MAADARPSATPAATPAVRHARRWPNEDSWRAPTHTAYATTVAPVAVIVTGSPASAWKPNTPARAATARVPPTTITRSAAQNTQGIAATDHERFGKFPVETTGPDTANAMVPSAAASGEKRRRRNR